MTNFDDEAPRASSYVDSTTEDVDRNRGTSCGLIGRVFLAGVGIASVATEVSEDVFNELVSRGEQTRDEAREEMRARRERGAKRGTEAASFVRSRMDDVLNRINLPSKGDVDSINAKLNILTRKIDQVQASQVDFVAEPSTGEGTHSPEVGPPPV